MRPFSLVMAYYDNPEMLKRQIDAISELPSAISHSLYVVIIDDGSPRWPALEVCTSTGMDRAPADRFKLFRMGVDVPWNQDACRNIGVQHAATEWVLLTDMDHMVPAETWRRLMWENNLGSLHLHKKTAYRFARVSAPDMQPYKLHPNTWAMRTKLFWKAGGYDEALAGNYGTDGDFMRRVAQVAAIEDLPDHVIRIPREVIPDASTTTLERKNPQQKAAIQQAFRDRLTNPAWKPQHFRFPYTRVL